MKTKLALVSIVLLAFTLTGCDRELPKSDETKIAEEEAAKIYGEPLKTPSIDNVFEEPMIPEATLEQTDGE